MPVKPIPDGYRAVTPYLLVHDLDRIAEFMKKAFGAKQKERIDFEDGSPMHVTMLIEDCAIMLAQAQGEHKPMPSMLYIYVKDVDKVYEQAIAAGGIKLMAPKDQAYGDRCGGVRDGSGNQWWIGTHIEDVKPAEVTRRYAAENSGKPGGGKQAAQAAGG